MTKLLRWRKKHLSSSINHVPAIPGLYAIGHDKKTLGLETEREFVYVGKTQNLRRRLAEHTPWTELKPELKKYLRTNKKQALIWYTTDVGKSDLDATERQLIKELKPPYNIQGKNDDAK